MSKRENKYQSELIKRIERLLPGCLVLKNDEHYLNGIPDLTILYCDHYAVLEVKKNLREVRDPGPNQTYYVNTILNMGGFADFICPETEDEVLHALQSAFHPRR